MSFLTLVSYFIGILVSCAFWFKFDRWSRNRPKIRRLAVVLATLSTLYLLLFDTVSTLWVITTSVLVGLVFGCISAIRNKRKKTESEI